MGGPRGPTTNPRMAILWRKHPIKAWVKLQEQPKTSQNVNIRIYKSLIFRAPKWTPLFQDASRSSSFPYFFPALFERHQQPSGWWRHGAGQTRSPSAACWLPAIVPSAGKWLKACSGTCHWRRRKSFTHWEIQRCEIVLTRIVFWWFDVLCDLQIYND